MRTILPVVIVIIFIGDGNYEEKNMKIK